MRNSQPGLQRISRVAIGLCLGLISPGSCQLAFSQKQSVRVAVVHSYRPGEWYTGLNDGLRASFTNFKKAAELETFIYDSDKWETRGKTDRYQEKSRLLEQLLAPKYTHIIVCDDEAADLLVPDLLKHENKKIFFTGINRSENEIAWLNIKHANLSGVLERFQVPEALEILKLFNPAIRSLSILTSATGSSLVIAPQVAAQINKAATSSAEAIQLRKTYMLSTWSEWQSAILEISEKDQALWLLVPYGVKAENGQETPITVIGEYLRAHLHIPTLGIISVHTKIGVLAAISVSPYDLGAAVGEQVVRSLNGEAQKNIGIYPLRKSRLEINLQEARRLNIRVPEKLKGIATMVDLRELPLKR